MSNVAKTKRHGQKLSWGRKVFYLLMGVILMTTSFPISATTQVAKAGSKQDEVLDVSFGGAFSTEKGYTNPTGEIMDGQLTRRSGSEQITEGKVTVGGNQDGIDFEPRASLSSETAKILDQAVVVEAEFTPTAEQSHFNTILSIGGNLYVRYISATEIEYGFEVNQNGNWKSVKQTMRAPKLNEAHTIAIAYEPTEDGAIMHAYLNGMELPAAVSTDGGAAWSTDLESEIGFGNEVHQAAQNRGFQGLLSRVVVTNFEGEFQPSYLKTMSLSSFDRGLSVSGIGTLENTQYIPAADEILAGKLEIHGGEITGLGRLNMSGKDSAIIYTPDLALTENNLLAKDYLAEIVLSSTSLTPGTILMDLAGAVQLNYSLEDHSIDLIVADQIEGNVKLPASTDEEYAHLSLLYRNTEESTAEVTVFLEEEQIGETISLKTRPKANYETVVYGSANADETGKNLKGEVYGVAFAEIEGDFIPNFFALLGGPCILPTDLEPGTQIDIKANECASAIAAKASLVRPDPKQVSWQEYEQTAFIHYGINTYYGVEWGDLWNHDDPMMFNPTNLDTDQWARSLRDSGFKMAVLTVKHHDGFALYPSRYTDFSVKNSPWKGGQGDVLREFADSMRKYGIKVGIYLSPSDHSAYRDGIFANGSSRSERTIPTLVENDDRKDDETLRTFNLPATDYGEMLLNQLYEVLTEYGEVDEVWFDGAQGNIPGNQEEKYDWDSFYTLIEELAPEAVVAVTGKDVRWVGNESGWARENEWSVLGATLLEDGRQAYHPSFSSPDLGSRSALTDAAANGMDYLTWWPAEVDVSIRDGWFYHDYQQPKSIDTLRNIYYQSIARNSVLLLNIPPNKEGKFADTDVKRLRDWHKSIKRDFAINHSEWAKITAENSAENADPVVVSDGLYETSWQAASTEPSRINFKFEEAVKVDRVVLQENINEGQQVESFAIDVRDEDGKWKEVYANEVIGYKRIASLPEAVTGKEFRVRILKSRGIVHLSEIGLYETISEGQAMAQLSGKETVAVGEPFTLNYGLMELPKEMSEGIQKQEIVLQYDPKMFEFKGASPLNEEEHRIVKVEEKRAGEILVVIETKGKLMKDNEEVLEIDWTTKNQIKQTKMTISKGVLTSQSGEEVEVIGTKHTVKVKKSKNETVDKKNLENLIEAAQETYHLAVEGDALGEYPKGTKNLLMAEIEIAAVVLADTSATQKEIDAASTKLQDALEKFEASVNSTVLSVADIKSQIEQFEKDGAIKNAQTARALTTHLTAVEQYEKKEAAEKVVKHMQSFKKLVDHQKTQELITDEAHDAFIDSAEAILTKWQ